MFISYVSVFYYEELRMEISAEEMSNLTKNVREAVKFFGIREVVEAVGLSEVIEEIGLKSVIEEVGLKSVIEEVGLKEVLDALSDSEISELRKYLDERTNPESA